jgi:uncharacterized phage protein (TIGR01671 family)
MSKEIREIRFRAFDKREGLQRMYYLTGFNYYGEGWTGGDPDCKFIELYFGNGGLMKASFSDIVLMQLTDQVDSDNKPVYEGDVYQYDYEYDSDYDGDMPIVKRSTGRASVTHLTDTYSIRNAKSEGGKVHVIGNIYENPDSLKKV